MDAQTVTNLLESVANDEIAKILDEELSTLPTDIQTVIILCELEGLSENQAAKQLGIPSSTLHDRLVKGRKLLKNGLVRRGVTVSLTGLTAYILSSSKTSAAISASLVADTTTKATLFAAGKTTVEIGVSSKVINTANKVLSAMNNVKVFSLVISAAAFLSLVGVLSSVVVSHGNSARAGPIVIDTFNDKNFADGTPMTWQPWSPGIFDASSGDLVLSPSEETDLDVGFGLFAPEIVSLDQSVRSQVRILETGHALSRFP